MKKKIVLLGIGNIGLEYANTRHNIGFDIIDSLLESVDVSAKKLSYKNSDSWELELNDLSIILVKPNTYVNLSGIAAKEVLDDNELFAEDLLVIVDDFHINLGTLRFRSKGSAGGHNGLKSLIEECGDNFHRLRVGIGPRPESESIIDFVLGHYSEEEKTLLPKVVDVAIESLLFYKDNGIVDSMNRFNSTKLTMNPSSELALED